MRTAIVAGPAWARAATQTAMNTPEGAHDQDVSRPETAHPDGLQDGGGAADQQGGKDGPGYVSLGLLGDAGDDYHGQHDGGHDNHGGLDSGAEGQQEGRVFFGFVADVFVYGGCGQRSTPGRVEQPPGVVMDGETIPANSSDWETLRVGTSGSGQVGR